MVGIFAVCLIVSYVHMNKLIHNQPNKKQINKRNAIYALLGSICFVMLDFDIMFGMLTGLFFGLICQNAYYEFKIKQK